MSIKKNKNQLIISILVGIAIFAITYQFVVKQHEENLKQKAEIEKLKSGAGVNYSVDENTTIYVVAKKDIPKDYIITSDDVEMKDLGMKTKGVYTDAKLVIGASTSKEIKAGFPVLKSSLNDIKSTANEPKPGFRAIAVTMPKNSLAPFIEDGAFVDIYTTNNLIQISNVQILKVADAGNKANKLILLEIKDEDVPSFIVSLSGGKTSELLVFAQRNNQEKGEYSFSYAPSYDFSNENFDSNIKNVSQTTEEPAVYTQTVKHTPKKGMETVELIQGNTKQTLDFE